MKTGPKLPSPTGAVQANMNIARKMERRSRKCWGNGKHARYTCIRMCGELAANTPEEILHRRRASEAVTRLYHGVR